MKAWTQQEHNMLISLLEDGVMIDTLCEAIPTRTEAAIVTRARNKKFGLDYRTSGKDRKLYKGVSRRYRNKDVIKHKKAIVGEARAVGAAQMPNTSERTKQNISDDIVSKLNKCSHGNTLKFIYDDMNKLLSSTKYAHIESITVQLENIAITVSKGLS